MRTKQWNRLDNAAKIFPAVAYGSDTQVFRLSCELTKPVDVHILQQALSETAAMFPVYQCVLRRGLLYEVTYFKNRVNLEMFHDCGRLYFRMSHCNQCNVSVRGDDKVCPLCQNQLTGAVGEALYPVIPTVYRQYRLIFKILTALTLSGGIICVGINLMLPQSGFWSVFVLFGILCFWISIITVLKRRGNLLKSITFQVVAFSLLFIALDFFIGWTGWPLNFFIPISCTVAILSLTIIVKVKKLPTEEYGVYLIADLLFCIVPIVFYFTELISAVLPSLFCMAVSVVIGVSQIVFEGKNLWQEIVKRFHV